MLNRILRRKQYIQNIKKVLLLTILFVIGFNICAFAESQKNEGKTDSKYTMNPSIYKADEDILFNDYLNVTAMKHSTHKSISTKVTEANSKKLSDNAAILYDLVRKRVEDIAAGKTDELELIIPCTVVTGGKSTFSAYDLGVNSIWADKEKTVPNSKAVEAINRLDDCIQEDILVTLFEEIPYSTYWCSGGSSGGGISGLIYDEFTISFDPDTSYFQFTFTLVDKYNKGDQFNNILDIDKISADAIAVENALAIVKENESMSDIDKLYAYKSKIEELTDYNYYAASHAYDEEYTDDDPWNAIYVFDGDPSTKVVCEGYSKAFKWLCDLTVFNSNKIKAYTVTGDFGSGPHMWNVIQLDDGRNYIADITVSDGYRQDFSPGDLLFLSGASSGSINSGYEYRMDHGRSVIYKYDEATKNKYGNDILTMSPYPYGGSATQHVHRWYLDYWVRYNGSSSISEYHFACTTCNEKRVEYADGRIVYYSESDLKKYTLPSVKISKLKAGEKAVTVKWKKLSRKKLREIKKIQIQFSTDKNFKKGIKTKYVNANKTSVKINKLKSKKKYYVRLRAYTKSGNTVHISKWSSKKAVKVR